MATIVAPNQADWNCEAKPVAVNCELPRPCESGNYEEYKHCKGRQRGKKAELAVGSDHVRLEIKQPESKDRHQHYLDAEQSPHEAVSKSCEDGERERSEVSNGAECRQRDTRYLGILARQDRLTTRHDGARNGLRRQVMYREVRRVDQTDKRDQSRPEGQL